MITIRLSNEGLADLPEGTSVEFPFERDQSGGYVLRLTDGEFNDFLRFANLVTYKTHLKEYDDGDVVGHFEVES